MRTLKLSLIGSLSLVACLIVTAVRYQADVWNKKTILRTNEAIMIPGATLTPGEICLQADGFIV